MFPYTLILRLHNKIMRTIESFPFAGINYITVAVCYHGIPRPLPMISFMLDPLSYFSFQPVLHDWCTKGRGMCYPVCGMEHIKEPLLLIGKSSLCGGSGFPLSL